MTYVKHDVLKLYAHGAEGKELMMLGRIRVNYVNGVDEDADFAARVEIEDDDAGQPKLKFFQGWVTRLQ